MKKFLKIIARYPIEFIILLAILPLTVLRPSFILSSFFLITSILLLWTIISAKKRPEHLSVALALSFFVIYIGLILFLDLTWLWFAPLFISILNIAIIKKLAQKNKVDPFLIVSSLKFLLLVIGLIPLLFILFQFLLQQKEIRKVNKFAKTAITANVDTDNLKNSLENISKEPILKELVLNNNTNESLPVLSALMQANNLSYLTVTDSLGYVRLRAHKPDALGDNLFLSNPEIKPVFENGYMEGYLKIQELPIVYARGIALVNEDDVFGAIFGGYLLNDNFVRSIIKDGFTGAIVVTENGNFGYYSNDQSLNTYLLSINADKNIKPFYDRIGKTDYLFLPLKIVNNSNKTIGYFVAAHPSDNKKQLSLSLFISLSSIILTAGAIKKWKEKI